MSLLALSGTNSVSGGFDIANSVKLEPDNAEFLKRNQADGNRKTWTYSMWVKRTELGMSNGMLLFYAGVYHQATRIFFDAGSDMDKLTIDLASEATTQYRWITKRLFRDTSAWYHFVWRVDTTQSTATDRMRMYVNGVLLTADDFEQTATFPQNTDTTANKSSLGGQQQMAIGNYSWANNDGIYAGYAAQCALVDGESLAPTEFGEFDEDTGIWKPKDISGLNYGTGNNSFFLDFEIASDLGGNAKGNDVNFTLNNITSANQATDTPTNNFATWQVLTGQPYAVIRNGATHYNLSGQVGWYSNVGSIAFTKGKWYAEFRLGSGITNMMAGVSQVDSEESWNNTHLGGVSNSTAYTMGFYNANGNVYTNNGSTAWGSSFPAGTIIMVAVDYKTSGVVSLYFGTNGTWANSSNPETGANNFDMNSGSPLPNNLAISFAASPYNNGGNAEANFGGFSGFSIASGNTDANGYGTFEYAPPSGYYALCTKNLAEYG